LQRVKEIPCNLFTFHLVTFRSVSGSDILKEDRAEESFKVAGSKVAKSKIHLATMQHLNLATFRSNLSPELPARTTLALTAGAMPLLKAPAFFVLGTRVSQARVNLIKSDSRTGMA